MMSKRKVKKKSSHLYAVIFIALVAVVALLYSFINQRGGVGVRGTQEIAKQKCDVVKNPVINITQKVVNSIDSGEAGNYWAFDRYNRHIQVWRQTNSTYCALVEYVGRFDGVEGQQSPGNTGLLTGDEDGTFKGGYRALIKGSLKDPADWKMQGNVGAYNYQCNILGSCPGAFNWMNKYFNTSAVGFTSTLEWWGWTYNYKNKVWINSSDGNSGDVL